jgi:hypothetical protein
MLVPRPKRGSRPVHEIEGDRARFTKSPSSLLPLTEVRRGCR